MEDKAECKFLESYGISIFFAFTKRSYMNARKFWGIKENES